MKHKTKLQHRLYSARAIRLHPLLKTLTTYSEKLATYKVAFLF